MSTTDEGDIHVYATKYAKLTKLAAKQYRYLAKIKKL